MIPNKYPSLLRRLAAQLYDSFLILAIFIAGTIVTLVFTQGQAIAPNNLIYQIYLLLLWLIFMSWFWSHGGQTAGMAAWHLKLVNYNNQYINFETAVKRFLLMLVLIACGGLGLWWVLIDKNKQTLYDRLLKTKIYNCS